MDFSTALTLIQTILQLLDTSTPLLREIKSVWGYKSQLKKLEKTLSTIQNVLLEAEQQQRHQQLRLSFPLQGSLARLNEVLYDAEDLFDEVATLVQRKKLMSGNVVSKEVTLFLSRFNQLVYAFTKSSEIKSIRKELDDIAKNHREFGSMIPQPTGGSTSNLRETGSLLSEEDVIIGRDDDKRVLIDMLLHTAVEESVSCVSIVGIGGLGKTTLAQLVYNDERIKWEFQLRMWVCVSNDFDVKALLGEILAAAINQPKQDGLSMDQLQTKIQEELDGKKYLLVLDDVWGDVTSKWDELRKPLIRDGSRGSRILVTTRLANMAKTIGGQTHELKGLSDAESWVLFERNTLKSRDEMMELNGDKILKKCAAVPLAIKVIGRYLQDKVENKWMHIANTDLATESNEGIMPILKISYYDLPLHLKRCFSYCAIFPKDYEITKDELIYLWMAQDFIKPDGQRLEDVGEEYFMHLLQRCFFQDAKYADDGEIISCKMHDLIHDVAQNIVGTEMMLLKDNTINLKAEVRHAFVELKSLDTCRLCKKMKRMRTILIKAARYIDGKVEISKVRNLRALSLSASLPASLLERMSASLPASLLERMPAYHVKKMQNGIGELIHLRYLDFSHLGFHLLPPSITSLFNLQTLKLRKCSRLKKLPKDLAKLVNLRCLDLHDCESLNYMPPGMGKMTCLHKLTRFVLGSNKKTKADFLRQASIGGIEDLKCLKFLSGTLQISIAGDWTYDPAVLKNGRYILEMEQLKKVEIELNDNNNAGALLEALQPNRNLQTLKLSKYPYERFTSSWVSKNLKSCLPQLVEICISGCSKLKHLPSMRQLPKLRALRLIDLRSLEYVESNDDGVTELGGSRQEITDDLVFFPSLQTLKLEVLPELVGWGLHSNLCVFPKLDNLVIGRSDKLTAFLISQKGVYWIAVNSYSEALSFYNWSGSERKAEINGTNVEQIIKYLSKTILDSHLIIRCSDNIERLLSTTKDVFRNGRVPSLRCLEIRDCKEMGRLSELEEIRGHLTALETLKLKNLPKLKLKLEDKDDNGSISSMSRDYTIREGENQVTAFGISLRFFAPTLCKLELEHLPKLVNLPSEIKYFTSLHSLVIRKCKNLKRIAKEIWHLTALESLTLNSLPELELEWEEEDDNGSISSMCRDCRTREGENQVTAFGISLRFFAPTLCKLLLLDLPKLVNLPSEIKYFTSLHFLHINHCHKLKRIAKEIWHLTALESLTLNSLPELELEWEEEDDNGSISSMCRDCITREGENQVTAFGISLRFFAPTLCKLELEHLPKLVNLPSEIKYFTSLHSLVIRKCKNLKRIAKEIWHLTALESLRLNSLPELELEWEEEEEEGNHVIAPTLRSFELCMLPKLVKLPKGMRRFTSLHSLSIWCCDNLEELPDWIGCFTSLHSFQIVDCEKLKSLPQEMCQLTALHILQLLRTSKELKKRCEKRKGADWPKIQHIPNIQIYS